MEQRNITITLEKAREWYYNGNAILRKTALQAYSEKELNVFDFKRIKTFKDALLCLYPFGSKGYKDVCRNLTCIKAISKASAAMFKLSIIRRALNRGYDLHLTDSIDGKNCVWYPYFRFIVHRCRYYNDELKNGTFKKIGEITDDEVTYDILSGSAYCGSPNRLGVFNSYYGVGAALAAVGFFGCATEEIAEHFSLHFGTLIMEAMYGDMVDFKKIIK